MYNIENVFTILCAIWCVILHNIFLDFVHNILEHIDQILLTILLNIACNFVYNIEVHIVHIVHIARVFINCTYCQYCTILLNIAHKIAQVWFADAGSHRPGCDSAPAQCRHWLGGSLPGRLSRLPGSDSAPSQHDPAEWPGSTVAFKFGSLALAWPAGPGSTRLGLGPRVDRIANRAPESQGAKIAESCKIAKRAAAP